MEKRISILTKAYTFSEYCDEPAEFAALFFTREEIREIQRLVRVVNENKLRSGTTFDIGDAGFYGHPVTGCDIHATDEVEPDDLEAYDGETCAEDDYLRDDGTILHIRDDGTVFFSSSLKHTDINIETEAIQILDIAACLDMNMEDAAKHVNSKSVILKTYAAGLLAKGE